MSNEEVRTYDGFGNNIDNPEWGAANQRLLRRGSEFDNRAGGVYQRPTSSEPSGFAYNDGVEDLARGLSTNPRVISNLLCKEASIERDPDLTDMMWAWGQYLDHEIDVTRGQESPADGEAADILVPGNDPEPTAQGGAISFGRSAFDSHSGTGPDNPREQRNDISAYIDASNVYGSDANRSLALRALDGTGKMKTSSANLLPLNTMGLPNDLPPDRPNPDTYFVSGDTRVNETAVLTAMHTLFIREHNRVCGEIATANPAGLPPTSDPVARDECLYQCARRYVAALEQVITYEEFLPALLGPPRRLRPFPFPFGWLKRFLSDIGIQPYTGYKSKVNAGIDNVFSTACYRLGHSMLSETVKTPNLGTGDTTLREMFFSSSMVQYMQTNGIEAFLEGLSQQKMRKINTRIVESVRSFLFGPPTAQGLLDLAALNIQRGRDHGLPDYNTCRKLYGLQPYASFEDMTGNDLNLAAAMSQAYGGNVNLVDPWIGGLTEKPKGQARVGLFIGMVLRDQFERLRDGDRFWYENDDAFNEPCMQVMGTVDNLRQTRLSDVIRRNTTLTGSRVPDDMFRGV